MDSFNTPESLDIPFNQAHSFSVRQDVDGPVSEFVGQWRHALEEFRETTASGSRLATEQPDLILNSPVPVQGNHGELITRVVQAIEGSPSVGTTQEALEALKDIFTTGTCDVSPFLPPSVFYEYRDTTRQLLSRQSDSESDPVLPFEVSDRWVGLLQDEENSSDVTAAVQETYRETLENLLVTSFVHPKLAGDQPITSLLCVASQAPSFARGPIVPLARASMGTGWAAVGRLLKSRELNSLNVITMRLSEMTATAGVGISPDDPKPLKPSISELWALRYLDSGVLYSSSFAYAQHTIYNSSVTCGVMAKCLRAMFIASDILRLRTDLRQASPGNIIWSYWAHGYPLTASTLLASSRVDFLDAYHCEYDIMRQVFCRTWMASYCAVLCNRRNRGFAYASQLRGHILGLNDQPWNRISWEGSRSEPTRYGKAEYTQALQELVGRRDIRHCIRHSAANPISLQRWYRSGIDSACHGDLSVLACIVLVLDIEDDTFDKLAIYGDTILTSVGTARTDDEFYEDMA